MNSEQFLNNLWVKLSEKQAEQLSGGRESEGVVNPGGRVFDELPGKGHINGNGKAKENWEELQRCCEE